MGTSADSLVSDRSESGRGDEWYIDAAGQVEGPISAAELSARAADGRLRPTSCVSRDRADWVPAGTVPGLTFPPRSRPLLDTVVSGSINSHVALLGRSAADVPAVSVPGYEILGTLGRGACGVVYKARQEKLNRVVALKTVLMPDRASEDLIERFKQEAVALARLHHPNVVAVFDSGLCETPPGQVFFAMELLDGEDLERRVQRAGPLDERTVWLVARQTAAALAHAGRHGVVHRDVKPANLFLIPPPTGFPLPPDVPMVKVTDFGLALTRGGPGDTDARQTAAGVLLGTPIYMAPEQFTGSDVDARADIYSLGASVYHALTGRPPYDGTSVYEVMRKKAGPAPRLGPPISESTAALVAAMMAERAGDRPGDYTDLLARIDALPCLEGGFSFSGMPGVSARVPAPPVPAPAAPRRRRWVYAGVALGLLGAAAGAAVLSGALDRKPATYTVGASENLYDGQTISGWTGRLIRVEDDGERNRVLTFPDSMSRGLNPAAHFRVALEVDPWRASAVEVEIATTTGPAPIQWVVRLDRGTGATFGKRTGSGPFEPSGPGVPLPTAEEAAAQGRRSYFEVSYKRAGGVLAVWFRDRPLGRTPDAGLRTTELNLRAIGGAARLGDATFEELVERK